MGAWLSWLRKSLGLSPLLQGQDGDMGVEPQLGDQYFGVRGRVTRLGPRSAIPGIGGGPESLRSYIYLLLGLPMLRFGGTRKDLDDPRISNLQSPQTTFNLRNWGGLGPQPVVLGLRALSSGISPDVAYGTI